MPLVNDVFKALAHPGRRHLLERLRENHGLTLNELCEDLKMTRQAVTRHLDLLEGARLVVIIWHGRQKRHYLNPIPIQQVYERWIAKYKRHRVRR